MSISHGTERAALPVVARPDGLAASEFAYRYIKDQILNLVLPPGHIATEMDIASATGLSRTPVREAFLRLDAERLIELIPRRGALVTVVTARQMRELAATRLVLELHAALWIVEHQVDVGETLLGLVDRQQELVESGAGIPELIASDRDFHTAIVSAVRNNELTDLYRSMGDRQQHHGVTSFSKIPGRVEEAVPQHRRIAVALRQLDAEGAEAALRAHLERSPGDLERFLP